MDAPAADGAVIAMGVFHHKCPLVALGNSIQRTLIYNYPSRRERMPLRSPHSARALDEALADPRVNR